MGNKNFIEALSEVTGNSPETDRFLLSGLIKIIEESVSERVPVSISGFGTFEGKLKKELVAIHPVSGAKLLVPPKITLVFKPSLQLKNKVKDVR